MLKINGVLFPETKKLGQYELKETRAGHLDVYKAGEYVITFADCGIHTFDTVEELEAELSQHDLDDEDIDPFGNFGEYMAGQHDLGRQGTVEDYLSCLNR